MNKQVNVVLAVVAALVGGSMFWVGFTAWLISMIGSNPLIFLMATPLAMGVGYAIYEGILLFADTFDHSIDEDKQTVDLEEKIKQAGNISGISTQDLSKTLQDARNKLSAINDASMRLSSNVLRYKLLDMCGYGYSIISVIARDPKDYRTARSWLNTHIDQTLTVVKKFAELDKPTMEVVQEFEQTIDYTTESFKRLLVELESNNVKDLNVDMSVLREIIKH